MRDHCESMAYSIWFLAVNLGEGVKGDVRRGGGHENKTAPPLPGSSGGVGGQKDVYPPGGCYINALSP